MTAPGTSQPPIRVGPLAPQDRPHVEAILRATGVFRPEEVDVALELFDESFDSARSDYALLGALDGDGRLVGYACYGPTPGTDRTYDLYWIAVHPSAQGTGAGTRLLDEVERRAQSEHARLLVVETSSRDDYAATRGFYRARGYAVAAELGNSYAPGDDRVIFTKRFHSPHDGRGAAAR